MGVLNLWDLVSKVQVSCVTQHILFSGSLGVSQKRSQNKQCTPSFTAFTVVKPNPEGYPIKQPMYLCPVMLGSAGEKTSTVIRPHTKSK